jgi:hypothetical protein
MISPQEALLKTCWRLSPARTIQVFPPAGVSFKELFTYSLGSSAGPSKFLIPEAEDWSRVAAGREKAMIIRSETRVTAGECRLENFM